MRTLPPSARCTWRCTWIWRRRKSTSPTCTADASPRRHCGYVNKQKARALAKALDAGERPLALAISSTKAIACDPRLLAHIMREGGPVR
ncbi:hypothetical protein GCM10009846_08510 [Agrococcus versicolor]|uniref:Uncharacterized protein n=1 Tax=Agrococcus versicolor TaxID=501482 RepID=A0ABN3AMA6_9MICO